MELMSKLPLPVMCEQTSHKLVLLPAGRFSEGNIHIPVGVDSKRGKAEGQQGSRNTAELDPWLGQCPVRAKLNVLQFPLARLESAAGFARNE